MEDRDPQAPPNGTSPAVRKGERIYDTVATELIAVYKRNSICQIRTHIVAMRGHEGRIRTFVSVGRFFRRSAQSEDWHTDLKPWQGGPLLHVDEVPAVAAALQRAVERARELGWNTSRGGAAAASGRAETHADGKDEPRPGPESPSL